MTSHPAFRQKNIAIRTKEGKGPLLIFIHGFPDSSHIWTPIMAQLPYSCIAVDTPGLAGSLEAKPKSFHVTDVANYLADIMTELTEPVYLIGHDFGAAIAALIASKKIPNIKGLTLVNGPYPPCYQKQLQNNPKQQTIFKYAEVFARPDALDIIKKREYAALGTSYFDQNWISSEDKEYSMQLWKNDAHMYNALSYYADSIEWFKSGDMSKVKIEVPIGVFWGLKDHAITQENVLELGEYIDNLHIKTIPEAGHWSFRSHPQEFIQFLNEQVAGIIR